jgi:hypothetical protein
VIFSPEEARFRHAQSIRQCCRLPTNDSLLAAAGLYLQLHTTRISITCKGVDVLRPQDL